MHRNDYIEANRRAWNQVAQIHVSYILVGQKQ